MVLARNGFEHILQHNKNSMKYFLFFSQERWRDKRRHIDRHIYFCILDILEWAYSFKFQILNRNDHPWAMSQWPLCSCIVSVFTVFTISFLSLYTSYRMYQCVIMLNGVYFLFYWRGDQSFRVCCEFVSQIDKTNMKSGK